MQVLLVAPRWEYGDPSWGPSFEAYSFADTFRYGGWDVLFFDWVTLAKTHGWAGTNRLLREVVSVEKPPITFFILTGDHLSRATVRGISESGHTTTFNWYCDDHFNFEVFSKRWTPAFNWVITTSQTALPKYAALGFRNVIKSQWACNHFVFKRSGLRPRYDVTFVGARHGDRPLLVELLRNRGYSVRCWGAGWENGRLTLPEMIAVFQQSRVNLNFVNAPAPPSGLSMWKTRLRTRVQLSRTLKPVRGITRSVRQAMRYFRTRPMAQASHYSAFDADALESRPVGQPQIKGRTFEVPGCGGLLLTGWAENLGDYFEESREMVAFRSRDEMIEKVEWLLANEKRREEIADAGWRRVQSEHTYVQRLEQVFQAAGVSAGRFSLGHGIPGGITSIA